VIAASVSPAAVAVGVDTYLGLRLHNPSPIACINIVLDLETTPGLLVVRGSRAIEINRLAQAPPTNTRSACGRWPRGWHASS
jgi:hypothetical protein